MENFNKLKNLLSIMEIYFVEISNNEIAIPLPIDNLNPDDRINYDFISVTSMDNIINNPNMRVIDDEGFLHIQYDKKMGISLIAVTGEIED